MRKTHKSNQHTNLPKSVALSCAFYRWLLRLWPASSQLREIKSLMLSDFRFQCLAIYHQSGWRGVFLLWPSSFIQTFRDLGLEYFSQVQPFFRKLLNPESYAIAVAMTAFLGFTLQILGMTLMSQLVLVITIILGVPNILTIIKSRINKMN